MKTATARHNQMQFEEALRTTNAEARDDLLNTCCSRAGAYGATWTYAISRHHPHYAEVVKLFTDRGFAHKLSVTDGSADNAYLPSEIREKLLPVALRQLPPVQYCPAGA